MTSQEYWGEFLGVPPQSLDAPGATIIPHAGLAGYWGAWIFYRASCHIVSVPQPLLAEYQQGFAELAGDIPTISSLLAIFDNRAQQAIGPTYHGSLSTIDFTPSKAAEVTRISFEEAQTLADSGDSIGWKWSDPTPEKRYFGTFQDGQLAAISNYRPLADRIDSPGIYTPPQHRGRGFGKKVLSAASADGIEAGLSLVDYQTLCSNQGAIRVAESLGVRPFARHIAVRFHPDTAPPLTGTP